MGHPHEGCPIVVLWLTTERNTKPSTPGTHGRVEW
jgi:hypothetical protein